MLTARVSNKALNMNHQILSATTMNPIHHIQATIAPLREALLQHPVYEQLQCLQDLHIFMEHQIFAVWDYMSLLKALQRELTCVEVPWVPKGSPLVRKLINEMVLGVETDMGLDGYPASHYELYLEAMEVTGADTSPIKDLLREISFGKNISEALDVLATPEGIKQHVQFTFDTIAGSKVHEIAALITFGRRHLIPDTFRDLIEDLNVRHSNQLSLLAYYQGRHEEVEAGEHDPIAMDMIVELCGEDESKWKECQQAAIRALEYRMALYDSIVACISHKRQEMTLQEMSEDSSLLTDDGSADRRVSPEADGRRHATDAAAY